MDTTEKPDYGAVLVGFVTFTVIALVSHLRSTPYNNYVVLADAFLHGRPWINGPIPGIDALLYGGKHYVIEAPLPAILLLPLVALQGLSANQTLLATILAGVAIGTAWEIGRHLRVPLITRTYACGFLLLGTSLFWCAMLGTVWLIAHVCAVTFTLAALLEFQGKRRAWLIALYAACAAESRFALVAAIPVYAAILATDPFAQTRVPRLRSFCLTLIPIALLWVVYNEARWHLPYDIGYTAYYLQTDGRGIGSPFSLRYLGYEFYSFFIAPPEFTRAFPYVVPSFHGTALTWTSPALALAFLARRPLRWVIALWIATVLTAAPDFLYFANGTSQFGMRHALDFEPFLFLLMLLAAQDRMPRIGSLLCGYSMLVGIWGIWYVQTH